MRGQISALLTDISASNLAGEDAAPRTDFDLSQSQSAASVSQPQQQPQPIGSGIEIEAGGATERAVQAEGAEGQALEPGTPHRLAHEAHGVAAGDFNAGDKVCRLARWDTVGFIVGWPSVVAGG